MFVSRSCGRNFGSGGAANAMLVARVRTKGSVFMGAMMELAARMPSSWRATLRRRPNIRAATERSPPPLLLVVLRLRRVLQSVKYRNIPHLHHERARRLLRDLRREFVLLILEIAELHFHEPVQCERAVNAAQECLTHARV